MNMNKRYDLKYNVAFIGLPLSTVYENFHSPLLVNE